MKTDIGIPPYIVTIEADARHRIEKHVADLLVSAGLGEMTTKVEVEGNTVRVLVSAPLKSIPIDIDFTMSRKFPFGPTERHDRCRLCGTPPSGRRKTFCSPECVRAWRRGDRP